MSTYETERERHFITHLVETQGYIYRKDIKEKNALENNFFSHIEANAKNKGISLSQQERESILQEFANKTPFECAGILQDKMTLRRDDDTTVNLELYNTKEWCGNTFEVVNQLSDVGNRYDVFLLINGLPMVHIELKAPSVSTQAALKQINYYKSRSQEDSSPLLRFVQIFIFSNFTDTFYCVNNESKFFNIDEKKDVVPIFMWTDEENKPLNGLFEDFTPTFLEKCFLSKMISRYIVPLNTKKQLLILRPYQVHAVEKLISQVQNNSKTNGYIWHTTGSGKTLTSFKASTILRDQRDIDKIIFVVDRKDLDKQTIDEFNRFEQGCVDTTRNTDHLKKKLQDPAQKMIITTIQKMSRLLKREEEALKDVANKRVVMIFDECHRSQFGESNASIRRVFKNLQMFGFTGTPIFATNSKTMRRDAGIKEKLVTHHIFDECLHHYLIGDAIRDKNVLQFHIDYFDTNDAVEIGSEGWKNTVAQKIIESHKLATAGRQYNAIFATAKIADAIDYYRIFKRLQEATPQEERLQIACIFSPPPSMNTLHDLHEDLDDENEEYKQDQGSETKKQALEEIIGDYNAHFNKDYVLGSADEGKGFMAYHGDISERIKQHHDLRKGKKVHDTIDILIVVDMFLTGFDSRFLNTLYVDKNLEYHGLIQAYSRTNRLHNLNKPFGNIYNFRPLKEKVDEAIQIFSSKEHASSDSWVVRSYQDELYHFTQEKKSLEEIFAGEELAFSPVSVRKLSDEGMREFCKQFKDIVKTQKALEQHIFEDRSAIETVYPKDDFKAMVRAYLDLIPLLTSPSAEVREEEKDRIAKSAQLDLELELFHSDIIDVEYIKNLAIDYVQKSCSGDVEAFISRIEQDVTGKRESARIRDFIKYCCEEQHLEGRSKAELEQAYSSFKEARERAAWKALCDAEGLDWDALWKIREGYIKTGVIDGEETLLKGETNMIARIKRMRALERGIAQIVEAHLGEYWSDEQ